VDRWDGGGGALCDVVPVAGGAAEIIRDVRAVGHQATRVSEFYLGVYAGQAMASRRGDDVRPLAPQECIRDREYRARAAPGHAAKRSVDPLSVPPFDHSNVES